MGEVRAPAGGAGGGAGTGGRGGGTGGAGVLGASASISILTSVIHDCAIACDRNCFYVCIIKQSCRCCCGSSSRLLLRGSTDSASGPHTRIADFPKFCAIAGPALTWSRLRVVFRRLARDSHAHNTHSLCCCSLTEPPTSSPLTTEIKMRTVSTFAIAALAGASGGLAFAPSTQLRPVNTRSNGVLKMVYIPDGLSAAEWNKIKAAEKKKKENLGKMGPSRFKSRSFQVSREQHVFGGCKMLPLNRTNFALSRGDVIVMIKKERPSVAPLLVSKKHTPSPTPTSYTTLSVVSTSRLPVRLRKPLCYRQAWQESGAGHLFPVDPKKVRLLTLPWFAVSLFFFSDRQARR